MLVTMPVPSGMVCLNSRALDRVVIIMMFPRIPRARAVALSLAFAFFFIQFESRAQNGVLREVYENIGGNNVSDLLNAPSFPDHPTSTNIVTDFFEAPINVLESYGQRMRGYILAPTTGNYTFWIASDDGGALYLSTDDEPTNKRQIASVSSWTASREWTKFPEQQSAPIPLQQGQRYYIEALEKEGGGGDHLAVGWQLPNGTEEKPIPASRLIVFGALPTIPKISVEPADLTGIEGDFGTFTVVTSNFDLLSYQWRKNSNNIPGANASTLVFPRLDLADDGAFFQCLITNKLGATNSRNARLIVLPDKTPPSVATVQNIGTNQIRLVFSEAVDPPTGTNAGAYSIDGAVIIQSAVLGMDNRTVLLNTSPLTINETYSLTVQGVTDLAVAKNPIAPGTRLSFTVYEYTPENIGNPSNTGSIQVETNAFVLTGGGQGIGGAPDEFRFAYQTRTGDFDMMVQLSRLTLADTWSEAGLMARETLEPSSRFAAAVATPSLAGTFFQARSTIGGNVTNSVSQPVNFPNQWLRMRRAGNFFTGYASMDGSNWLALGSTSIPLPPTIHFGMLITSRDTNSAASARFQDLAPTRNPALIATFDRPGERLAASSRRTGLVISEIMYRPAPRGDGKNLEFVEIYNSNPFFEDISGHRISGDIDYVFPPGTILKGGAFIVVARAPNDVRSVYGIENVMGPYEGSLKTSGTVKLKGPQNQAYLEVSYESDAPWPVAANGSGHSLVLARPSYGEGNPEAWDISDRMGGSPGILESFTADPMRVLKINELLAHTDLPDLDTIEIYNHGNQDLDLGGCVITDDPAVDRFHIPPGTTIPARGFVVFDETQLGFRLNAGGETLLLRNATDGRVLDSLQFPGQENGIAFGRWPDGAPDLYRLGSRTFGAANSAPLGDKVVINELLYDPISGNEDDQFIELYNSGAASADISGWEFDGIKYVFPANTILLPNAYAVVARNATNLLARYTNLTASIVFGNFSGKLSGGGERIALIKPDDHVTTNAANRLVTNKFRIPVDEVRYRPGGRWPRWANGGGSSMELIDPRSNHRLPSNWADSDERGKAPWTNVEATGVLDNGTGSSPAGSFQFLMLGAGECLVDNVEVFASGSTNVIGNGEFESGTTGWAFQGTHSKSFLESSEGFGGSARSLHVVASDRGDTGANRIRKALNPGIAAGKTAILRAKVRWLKGEPSVLLRLRGNWLEAFGALATSPNPGTPGLPNSRALSNAGPAIYEVTHFPPAPAAGKPVLVTTKVSDPDGIAAPILRYRIDPSSTYTSLAMNDAGAGGDGVAGDGVYSATIPGQAAGKVVAFYVEATDTGPVPATTRFPSDAPARQCLVLFGDGQGAPAFGTYRLWMTQATVDKWSSREKLSNDPLDCTFVYDNSRVIYNMGAQYAGSPYHSPGYDSPIGSPCGYSFEFPLDDLFLGTSEFGKIHWPGNGADDDTQQREKTSYWITQQLGLPYNYQRFINLFVKGQRRGVIFEDLQNPNGEVLNEFFPGDADGDLHKASGNFEFPDDLSNFDVTGASLAKFTTTGGVKKTARYRWLWQKRAVKNSLNNFANLFGLVDALNLTDSSYTTRVDAAVDVDQWVGISAVEHIVGNWDTYVNGGGQNLYAYKPVDDKWKLLIWDLNIDLGVGGYSDGPTSDLFKAGDVIPKFFATAPFNRAYWRVLKEAADGPLNPANVNAILDARYAAFTANGVAAASPTSIKSWIATRRDYVYSQLGTVASAFSVVNSGAIITNASTVATLTGSAPVEVTTIRVNGVSYPVTWNAVTAWRLRVAVQSGTNVFQIEAFDKRGQRVGLPGSVTVFYKNPTTPEEQGVVISEIMANPAVPDAEYVEVFNRTVDTTYDLSNWRIDGVDYQFSGGTLLQAGSILIVSKNRAAFLGAYGNNSALIGTFEGNLQADGETLRLVKPGVTPGLDKVINEVTYEAVAPWPILANASPVSLQLVDADEESNRAANWSVGVAGLSQVNTPGAVNSIRSNLPPFLTLRLNEVLPRNENGIRDGANSREPWLEIFNTGSNDVSLDGAFLSDNYTQLTRWAFPSNAVVPANGFVLVWADGDATRTTTDEWHANFRLSPGGGSVAFSAVRSNQLVLQDYLNYPPLEADLSFGSYPDGRVNKKRVLFLPTPGGTNNADVPAISARINEWMASNASTIEDPANAATEDWFELYNPSDTAARLDGFYLGTSATNPAPFKIPAGYTVPPKGFLLVWADKLPDRNSTNDGDLHVDFKLAKEGASILLIAPDLSVVDSVRFGLQMTDVSEGRFPDGAAGPFLGMPSATPRLPNRAPFTNHPPRLAVPGTVSVVSGELLQVNVQAMDEDLPAQTLTFSLDPESVPGPTIDPVGGALLWNTAAQQPTGIYPIVVRVTDNGVPPLSDARMVQVIVEGVQPRFSEVTADDFGLHAKFHARSGQAYQIQFTPDLDHPNWRDVGGPITGDGAIASPTLPLPVEGSGYFRVVVIQ
jgi:hypothetical protein